MEADFENTDFSLKNKKEYMPCNFSKRQDDFVSEVKIIVDLIPHVSNFKYQESIS